MFNRQKSLRIGFALVALVLISSFTFASITSKSFKWFGIPTETVGSDSQLVAETKPAKEPLTIGTCDIGNNIEVEGTNSGNNAGYATLTAAFAAINAGTHTGTITIDVCGNTTETGTGASLNASGSGSASYTTITISPAGGAARIITGSLAAPLLDLNGADNVTINGLNSGGNSLTLSNTSTSSTAGTSTVRFINGAQNNLLTRCNIQGSSTVAVGTAGGAVLFSTTTGVGNNTNTVSLNNIGPAGANLPVKAISAVGTTTSTTTINSDNVIDGNNVFDFFGTGGVSVTGIDIRTGNNNFTIQNNRIYQTAPRTFTTTALRYAGITLVSTTGAGGNAHIIRNNVIGFGAANGTGTTTISGSSNEFRGLDLAAASNATATSVQGNIISGINQTSSRASTTASSSPFIGIMVGTTSGLFDVGSVTGNQIGSLDGSSTIVVNATSTTASNAPVIAIYDFSLSSGIVSNNNIGAITIQSTGTTVGFRGILVNTSSAATETINNNTIGGATAAGAIVNNQVGSYVMYGIQTALPAVSMTGNTIRNIVGNSTFPATVVGSGITVNISTAVTTSSTISRNTIHSLTNNSGAAQTSIYAMDLTLPANASITANVVERNFIHSLVNNSTDNTSQLWGIIQRGSGTAGVPVTATVKNNMIRLGLDAAGNSITSGQSIIGIRDIQGTGGAGTTVVSYYFNSVYIGGTGVASSSSTFAFNGSALSSTRGYVDNIFWNARSNASGAGKNYAITVGGTAPNPAGLTSNYNDLLATGTGGFVGLFNSVDQPTLANWRTSTGQDLNSISADPLFVNPTGNAASVDLHLQAGSPAIDQATNVGVTNDFDGDSRPGANSLFDIGADEIVAAVPGTLALSSATYTVGEGGGNLTVTVNRTGGDDGAVTVDYTLTDGTATGGANCGAGVDFDNDGGTVSFADGETSKTFNVPICEDAVFEDDETFTIGLQNATGGATIGSPSSATATIQDNEVAVPGSLQFSASSYTVSEGVGTATITVTRTGGSDGAVSVSYATVVGGSATGGATCGAGVDFVNTGGTLNWSNGDGASKTFSVTICDDNVYETPSPETVSLALSSPTGGATLGTPNTATLNINENDTAPSLQFSSATYTNSDDIAQSAGKSGELAPQVATITVTRTGATENAVSVNYATVAGGSATGGAACGTGSGVDYITTSGTLNFAAGDISETFNITVCTDNRFEGDETVNLALTAPTAPAILGTPNTAVLTITDNDTQPSLQFSSTTYSVGEGGGSATITVTRTGAVDNAVSVNYATVAGGTATGGASCGGAVDYVNASGTLTFGAGVISQTFNVSICDDASAEGSETVNLALASPGGGAVLGTPNTAVLTITDNDGDTTAPTLSYTPLSNVATIQNRTISVNAADNVGIQSVTVTWFYDGAASGSTNGCTFQSGTTQNGTWSCLLVGLSGSPTNPGTVTYYVRAFDTSGNSTANPSGANNPAGTRNLYTVGSNGTIDVTTTNTFENLVVGNGFTLNGNATVTGNLTLNGIVNTGANTLTLGCNATVTGGSETNYVIGNLEKQFCGIGLFTYNVGAAFALPPVTSEETPLAPEGTPASNYSPLTVTITGGTVGSSLTVSVTDAFMAGAVQVNSISRYWTLTENGNLTADLAFTYRNEDVVGTETSYNVLRRAGGMTANYPGGTVNAATNTFNAFGVTDFSQWSAGIAVPTAANAEISGRLVTASGEGIRNATVMLSGGTLSQPIYVQTGTFGSYRFTGLPVGQIYVITVISKRYTFANPSRIVNLTDNAADENFFAEPQ